MGVALLAAVLLVGAAEWNHRGVVERARELTQAQGELLGRQVHQSLGSGGLDQVVEDRAEDGLVWVGVLGPGGALSDQAGTPGDERLPDPDHRVLPLQDTVRFFVPPGEPGRVTAGPPTPGGMPRSSQDRARPALVIEYHPVAALDLRTRSQRSRLASGAAALLLVLVAALASRSQHRAAAAERDLEQARHLAALGQMSAVLAHEIRNPLASLKGHAQLLGELVEGQAPLERRAARVVSEAERLEALTNSLLDFARSTQVDRQPTALAELLAQVAEGRDRVEVRCAELRASVDPLRLRQVLDNLVDNALQADPDGTVELAADRVAGALRLTVRDHGPGVPADQRETIFAPFHTGRTRGTGLGLAVARRIVQLHGGTLTVDDAPGGGACFTATIPES
ncbi:MAG: HAMP domain-containing histidine kinase [Alphaproteobacteria bacterium]|nr:HAMP domain-containing histidine kinase [Alphaproteobacteria bacterium]